MWDQQFEATLRKHLPYLGDDEELSGGAELRDLGLDSMGTVELLSDLEKTYGLRFVDDALNLETFATPDTLWSALSGLRAANA
ncbi:Phosphopantetheine attachment site [Streptomyces zhaozhouensis]|uniref:Phosphopantetheine attachment site n=1 Tax=Streptomyces zhaozhouensis TaxID=1300267 RepID=A0A286E7I4_9ACTN|nr:phosphopantetheine-binding protein [Streptomyces zhaozhouensis]SOD66872.1 Phosphopantetheine attachment site [Streptomyces zhaozhouensis]